MKIYLPLLAFLLSAGCGFLLIPQILNYCKRKNLYDIPNERKVHKNAIPRMGGISFMPSMLIAALMALLLLGRLSDNPKLMVSTWSVTFLLCLVIIYAVGILDDLIGISARTKFVCQMVAATLLTLSGLYINNLYGLFGIEAIPRWVGIPLTVLVIMLINNAMNLIDGIDGLAGSLALLALLGFLVCFWSEGLWVYVVLIAGLAGVLVPFLYFNLFGDETKNRKIFMGDSGSLTLGFLLGFLFIKVVMYRPDVMNFQHDNIILAMSVLMVPVFDVLRVIVVRLRQHKPIFMADKNHVHHKLMSRGMSQHRALTVILLLAVSIVAVNVVLFRFADATAALILAADVALMLLFHWLVGRRKEA